MIFAMLSSSSRRAARAALVMSAVLVPAVPVAAQYAAPRSYAESPEDALARNLRLLAQDPRNFQALVAAGRAALETGDTQAAAGFFGRAAEISPRSWQPQAGMGAAMVAMGDPQGALPYFSQAQALGATHMLIALDRGLAFDLVGDQAKAQSDYRVAMAGAQMDEARRRLALSLAISRDINGAKSTLDPLLRRGNAQAARTNAFILALAGDRDGARRAIDATMPGAGARFDPFFVILPVLTPAEKAAAVHLGIFPKDAATRQASAGTMAPPAAMRSQAPTRIASASVPPAKPALKPQADKPRRARESIYSSSDGSRYRTTTLAPAPRKSSTRPPLSPPQVAARTESSASEADPEPDPGQQQVGRLDEIVAVLEATATDEPLVKVAETETPDPQPAFSEIMPISRPKVESSAPAKPKNSKAAARAAEEKKKAEKLAAEKKAKAEAEKKAKADEVRIGVAGANWVQLAGGANKENMAAEYKRLRAKAGTVLKSRAGYVTEGKDYFRLLVGPFPSTDEAQDFVTKLDKQGVDSFRWTRSPARIKIEKLKT